MNEFLKFYQNKPLKLKFNKNDDIVLIINILNLEVGIDVASQEKINVITIEIENKEVLQHYLYSMIGFHLKKELKDHLSLFSIEGDLSVSLR